MSTTAHRIAGLSASEKRALLVELLKKKPDHSAAVFPLSYNQQGIWFLYQLAPESTVYNVTFAARVCSAVDLAALRRSFQALVDRHPSLRTTFSVAGGKPMQKIHRHQQVHFVQTDAAAWGDDEVKARLLEDAYRTFDLE